ncbi:MAG: hypothetical protein JWN71_1511 [Xanthobacteraceae bacterium]|nr:hypothetical protein [Xanthobacteraceae bacterium]
MRQSLGLTATICCLAVFNALSDARAAECDTLLAEVQAYAQGVSGRFESAQPAKAGIAINVRWTNTGTKRPQLPIYLVLKAPADVRFAGDTFLALGAGAEGPQKIKYGSDGARALVPLNRAVDTSKGGSISVLPYRVGRQNFSLAVVTAGQCGERVFERGAATVDVAAGAVELVVQDRFSLDQPLKRIRAKSGSHDLLVFKSRYEVHDVATGAKIIDRPGIDANFSPACRFVAARREADGRFEVFDLVSQTELPVGMEFYDGPIGLLAWARGDSYLLLAGLQYGEIEVVNTLVNDGTLLRFNDGCKACRSWNDGQVILDVDRGFVALNQDGAGRIVDLTARAPKPDVTPPASANILNDLRKSYDPSYPALPKLWELGEKIALSHATANKFLADETKVQLPFVVQHQPADLKPASPAADGDLKGQTQFGRALGPAVPEPASTVQKTVQAPFSVVPSVIFERIAAVGLVTRPRFEAESVYTNAETGPKPRKSDERASAAFAETMRKRVPAAAKLFRKVKECGTDAPGGAVQIDPLYVSQAFKWRDEQDTRWLVQTICKGGNAGFVTVDLYLTNEGRGGRVVSLADLTDAGNAQGLKGAEESQRVRVFRVSDRLTALVVPLWEHVELIDAVTAQRVGVRIPLLRAALLSELRVTTDQRHLVQLNSDGRFVVYRIADGVRVLSGVHVDDEIVVTTDDGRYDTTYEGAMAVQVRFVGLRGLHTFHQFQATLLRPGLAKSVLDGRDTAPAPPTLAAPPTVELRLASAVGRDGKRTGRVIASSDHELASLRLHVDGRLIREIPVKGKRVDVAVDLPDPGGARWITVVAVDAQRLVSMPSAVQIPGAIKPRGTLSAVVIGLDVYQDPGISTLASAKVDANNFARSLATTEGRAYKAVRVNTLLDQQVTPEATLSALREAAKATGPDDTLLFYFAGHGLDATALGQKAGLVLTTHTTKMSDIGGSSVPWTALADAITAAKGTVIFVLDSCHSGLAGSDAFTTNDAAVSALLTRSGAPMVVLAAAKGRQESQELPGGRGGQFTNALVHAVTAARTATDSDRSGLLDLREVYGSVKAQVQSATKGEQTPWLARNGLIGEMSLF